MSHIRITQPANPFRIEYSLDEGFVTILPHPWDNGPGVKLSLGQIDDLIMALGIMRGKMKADSAIRRVEG